MVTVYVHREGRTQCAPQLDPAWLRPDSRATVWVDFSAPTADEVKVLSDVFHFHPLSVEDAVAQVHYPKIETYDGYLYLILHGIDYKKSKDAFATHDTDFFLGPNYLVTIHDGQTRSIQAVHEVCSRNDHVLADGPGSLMHRIIDQMVDNYRPELEELETWLDELEAEVFVKNPRKGLVREILQVKRDITALRRIATPQRDAISRLARREFPIISQELAYRFRDVYDNLVRIADEALIFQDRVTGILEAHLSSISNRLNEVMKKLTVLTTIAAPFTVLGGLYGMNVTLPGGHSPDAFWWILAGATLSVVAMMYYYRRNGDS
jgi:magnesium transporter